MKLLKSKYEKKKFKALIVDVDGTLVPKHIKGMPSKRVTEAIKKASKKLHIGIASSRPHFLLKHIFSHLNLSGPSIMSGGAQIFDIDSNKILIEHSLDKKTVNKIFSIMLAFKIPFFVYDGEKDYKYAKSENFSKILEVFSLSLEPKIAEKLSHELTTIKNVSAHMVPSWKNNKIDVMVTNMHATKQYGILEVAKILKIETHEIIAVGDGYNDFPLLMACGLKIAMGNAVPDLKAIADYIAPTVEDDGVADVIEKFVL